MGHVVVALSYSTRGHDDVHTMRRNATFVLILLVQIAVGCHGPSVRLVPVESVAAASSDPRVADFVLPTVRGAPGAGAQALGAIMAFHDRELVAADVAEALPWHEYEATEGDLIAAARRADMVATAMVGTLDDLDATLRVSLPAMVRLDERGLPDRRHPDDQTPTLRGWVVVRGLDLARGAILIARERGRVLMIDQDEFERRWSAAGRRLLVLRPHVSAGEAPIAEEDR